MKTSIFNAFIFIFVIPIVINMLSFLSLEKFIVWTNIPTQSVIATREYLEIIFIGIVFVYTYNFIASILRSIGNTIVPLIFLAVSAITNIVFIVRLDMGVSGAAWATVIA